MRRKTGKAVIQQALNSSYQIENEQGFTHRLYMRFNEALSVELSMHDFMDMYAQTIVYGLFSARCMQPDITPFNTQTAVECVPTTNPLLKELLNECCSPSGSMHFDELNVLDIIKVLNNVDIRNILADFNRQTGLGKEDPIVYFYECFLNIYEKEQKKRRRVYYTPTPIVDFMVRAVTFFLKNKFNCPAGFLNPEVSVLDPATGTGTFLRRIIYEIYDEFHGDSRKGRYASLSWNSYVQSFLLSRLFGFEFMMAPYAVAHMKLAMTLKETGYDFAPEQRLQVYLANSLEYRAMQIQFRISTF